MRLEICISNKLEMILILWIPEIVIKTILRNILLPKKQSALGCVSSSFRENPLSVNMKSSATVPIQFWKETKSLPSPVKKDSVLECSLSCPRF